jgi:hypothetical protein
MYLTRSAQYYVMHSSVRCIFALSNYNTNTLTMKNFITAIVAFSISLSAHANHLHSAACPANCNLPTMVASSLPTEAQKRIAHLKNLAEEKKSQLNFIRTMEGTFQLLDQEKQEQAIKNLEAENAYNLMMSKMFQKLKGDKAANELAELVAAIRYEKMMATFLPQ